ncbi:MAG: RnfABCDGE type electron transport complex subunit D, partial [Pygmaiobacter sp.]
MDQKLIVNAAPHIRSSATTRQIMIDVVLALCPAILASAIIFGVRALLVVGVTAAASVAFEYLYCYLMKKPITIGDFSAVVTGVLLAMNLPSTIPLWMAIIGAFVSVVIVKELFGGLGHNFANPAI